MRMLDSGTAEVYWSGVAVVFAEIPGIRGLRPDAPTKLVEEAQRLETLANQLKELRLLAVVESDSIGRDPRRDRSALYRAAIVAFKTEVAFRKAWATYAAACQCHDQRVATGLQDGITQVVAAIRKRHRIPANEPVPPAALQNEPKWWEARRAAADAPYTGFDRGAAENDAAIPQAQKALGEWQNRLDGEPKRLAQVARALADEDRAEAAAADNAARRENESRCRRKSIAALLQ